MTKRILLHLALLCLCGLGFSAEAAADGRVIVKYRSSAEILKQAQSGDRAANLSTRLGLALRAGRRLDSRTEVIQAAGISSRDLATRLSSQSDVEFAVPDQLRRIRNIPNDTLYAGQWYLQSLQAAAIRADQAWDQTTGSAGVVIAFVDTGVRYDHPDLNAKLLPGYDFISDTLNAGDGNGRDSDANDTGDYISFADTRNAALVALCGSLTKQDSSWHGTRVAGILGAASNNSTGIAGTSWGAMLLPVRALGKCGGFDSDIIAGMRWAAGLSVPGVPDNPNPAKIINLSLGGPGSCDAAYTSAISELTSRNVLVVAAAGNESGPVESPANCSGVLAVAGVRHDGSKVGYSSFGPEISISAPAGNCVNLSGLCLYSIDTTSNSGLTTPAANTYTSQADVNVGTSFSTPMAAGVAALMLSVNPGLSPAGLISRIKSSARAFPVDSNLTDCPSDPTIPTDQCNCTTTTCGAGLLDASGAVAAVTPAAAPSAHILVLDPLTSSSIRLDGSGSTPTGGSAVKSWLWHLDSAPAGASLTSTDTATTSLQASATGTYVVSLTVTDSLDVTDTVQSSLQVVLPTSTSTTSSGGGGGALDIYALFGLVGLLGLTYWSRRSQAQRVPAR